MSTASGAPPGKRSGPQGTIPRSRTHAQPNPYNSVQAAADDARFHMAIKLGFEAGREVGRMQLDHELTEQDRRRMAYMHGLSNSPAYAALELVRWDGRREDFGQPRPGDFKGFGATYEPPITGERIRDERGAA